MKFKERPVSTTWVFPDFSKWDGCFPKVDDPLGQHDCIFPEKSRLMSEDPAIVPILDEDGCPRTFRGEYWWQVVYPGKGPDINKNK